MIEKKKQNIIEPPHDKTNRVACAPSEDSDQPGHPLRLSESSLGAQSFCWFCHEVAHMYNFKLHKNQFVYKQLYEAATK